MLYGNPFLLLSSRQQVFLAFAQVMKQIEQSVAESKTGKAPVISYTDDSAMTIVMARSLVECGKFDPSDMARRSVFKETFFTWLKVENGAFY